jgi:hypothetical protein
MTAKRKVEGITARSVVASRVFCSQCRYAERVEELDDVRDICHCPGEKQYRHTTYWESVVLCCQKNFNNMCRHFKPLTPSRKASQ